MSKRKKLTNREKKAREKKIMIEVRKGTPYLKISEKFGVAVSTVSRIKARNDPEFAENARIAREKKELLKYKLAATTRTMIRSGELLVDNMLHTMNIIVYGVDKLHGGVENAEKRIDTMQSDLSSLVKQLDEKINFPVNDKGKQPERDAIIKKIYTVLDQLSQFYPTNKILIDGVNGMRQHVETYTKLRIEEHAVRGLKNFFDVFFEGLNLLDDDNYTKFRDFLCTNSELSKQLFSSFDKEVG